MSIKKAYNLKLSPELHKQLRMFVAEHGSTMLDEITMAIKYWLEIGGSPPGKPRKEKSEPKQATEKDENGGMLHKPATKGGLLNEKMEYGFTWPSSIRSDVGERRKPAQPIL